MSGLLAESPAVQGTSGILLVDKPEGMSSFKVVDVLRRWFHLKKCGHCGTLDPLATGLLVLCCEEATRIADQLTANDKTYRFTVRLGAATDTFDRAGTITETWDGPPLSEDAVRGAVAGFTGALTQKVPAHSAVRVGGKRLYELARKGEDVAPPEREVTISRLDLLSYAWPEATFEADCSKGTFIRSLAHDFGRALGCGGHIQTLRRLASGRFRVTEAVGIEELKTLREDGRWVSRLIPMNNALSHLPGVDVTGEEVARRLVNGQLPEDFEAGLRARFAGRAEPVRLVSGERLSALWWPEARERRLRLFR